MISGIIFAGKAMKKMTEVDLSELCVHIQQKVESHYAYLTKFLTHPEGMLRRDFEVDVPKGYSILIENEGVPQIKDNEVILVIQIPRAQEEGHLSHHELDLVTGGIGSHYYRSHGHANYLVTGHGKHFHKFTSFLRKKTK